MSETSDARQAWLDDALYALLKEKLGADAFKEVGEFHIRIHDGAEATERMRKAILVCPAGLYKLDADGKVVVSEDGCLECGTCKIACGDDVLDWRYPDAMCGVQYRFG